MTRQNYLDDIELDEESIADIVMDDNALASMPRSGRFHIIFILSQTWNLIEYSASE